MHYVARQAAMAVRELWLLHAESELLEQRHLMEAVRGILTDSVQSSLGSEQQAFLQDEQSWNPPAPSTGNTSV